MAGRQGGFVTRSQLLDVGLTEKAIDWKVRSGEFAVVSAGFYEVFPARDHIDLIRGATLALPDAVASHQSAAHLLDLPRLPAIEPTVTVASSTTHRFPGVTVRRCDDLDRSHITRTAGVRVTTVARTLFDLAGVLTYEQFDDIAEASLLARRVEWRHLDRMAEQLCRRGKPGSRSVRDFLAIRDGGEPRATVLERKGRAVLASANILPPVPQFPIPWAPGQRFDDAYPDASVAIEWDSRTWHEQRAAMSSDRKRDRLAALHGWLVIRFTWEDVTQRPQEVQATVSKLLQDRGQTTDPGLPTQRRTPG